MKNTIKLFRFVILIAAIGFLSAGCLTTGKVNTSLEGVWGREDIVITITGESGVFTQINPNAHWHIALSNGSVRIGDLKFRNIVQTGHLKWTTDELSINIGNYTTSWKNSTITMDESGQTIQVLTSGGVINPDNTYTRVP